MVIRHLFYSALLLLITACSSSTDQQKIDYADLKELDYKTTLEISESEDFLPGQLTNIIISADGDIIVSDWASVSISQFNENGKFVATITQKGGGPGELPKYFSMQHLPNDTIMVTSMQNDQQDYFAEDENGIFQFVRSTVLKERSERSIEIVAQKSDTSFYARSQRLINSIQEGTKNDEEYWQSALVTTDLQRNILQDSVLLLKKGTSHGTEINGRGISIHDVPYRYDDRFLKLKTRDNQFMIARPDSNAFYIYNKDEQLKKRIPLNVKKRAVTDRDLDYMLADVDKKVKNEIKARVDEFKPPFLDLWTTKDHIWLKTDETEEGNQVVVVDFDGNPIGKLMLPVVDDIKQVVGKNIYTIHRSETRGNLIRKYTVKF